MTTNFSVAILGQSIGGGLSRSLTEKLQAIYGAAVRVDVCTVGGSSVSEWQPGTANYIAAVNKVSASVAAGFPLRFIILANGQRDSRVGDDVITGDQFYSYSKTLLSQFAAVFGGAIYVIITQLGDFPAIGFDYDRWTYNAMMQSELLYGTNHAPRSAYRIVRTVGIGPYAPDGLGCHYLDRFYEQRMDETWTGYIEIAQKHVDHIVSIITP